MLLHFWKCNLRKNRLFNDLICEMGQQYLPHRLVSGLNKLTVLRFIKDQFISRWLSAAFILQDWSLCLAVNLTAKSSFLASYLQRVISVHHPTVRPGGHDQKPSWENGQEAGSVLKKILHGSKQPVGKGLMGRCQLSWNAIGFWCYWLLLPVPGDARSFLFPHTPLAGTLNFRKNCTNRLYQSEGPGGHLSSSQAPNQKPGQGKNWTHRAAAWEKQPWLWSNVKR